MLLPSHKHLRYSSVITKIFIVFFLLAPALFYSCDKKNEEQKQEYPDVKRSDKLPPDISKRGPQTDKHPPLLHSSQYETPLPLGAGINTSGAEDSPFILPDGNTIYFFFTPDVRVPPEKQLLDSVSGIWVSYKTDNKWSEARRVWLQSPEKLALDGAVAVQGNEMWFASVREGYSGVNMFTAEWSGDKWTNWKYAGDRLMKELKIGEVHLFGDDLYFHSDRPGGQGAYDIWLTSRNGNSWSDAVNISDVNSSSSDAYPFITPDGKELWFTRTYQGTPAIFRSVKNKGSWGTPELIISQFAGECSLDKDGNIYFVHHFYENGVMIEADIYFAKRK